MLLPNRHGSSDKYRYGFQRQEKDDELKGEGNSLNYKFRMHDPRVGRFFSVDPLTAKYPHYSPYSFSGNKVIAFGELEGLEETIKIFYDNIHDAATLIKAMNDNDIKAVFVELNRKIVEGGIFNIDASFSNVYLGEPLDRPDSFTAIKTPNPDGQDVISAVVLEKGKKDFTTLFKAVSNHPSWFERGLNYVMGKDFEGITFQGGFNFADGGNSRTGIAGSSRKGNSFTIDFGGGLTAITSILGRKGGPGKGHENFGDIAKRISDAIKANGFSLEDGGESTFNNEEFTLGKVSTSATQINILVIQRDANGKPTNLTISADITTQKDTLIKKGELSKLKNKNFKFLSKKSDSISKSEK